ncbi:hypothetical protein CDAR_253821 [Caerostris darwini]|uniref:Uncharacterized protein n=1 Tax=Caerostris darwini TaxID=1538125 RepID=A0AAV4Q4J9_9ARAC|nr:hypothetical protein CDAR_253821 [Caerostris darwini]
MTVERQTKPNPSSKPSSSSTLLLQVDTTPTDSFWCIHLNKRRRRLEKHCVLARTGVFRKGWRAFKVGRDSSRPRNRLLTSGISRVGFRSAEQAAQKECVTLSGCATRRGSHR